jgi:glycosyltransferase involved in cell wall biosynthesis
MNLTVLILTAHYIPGFLAGGPIRSISNLVAELGDQIKFNIITSDRDHKSDRPYKNVVTGEWLAVGSAMVMYAGREMLRPFQFVKNLKNVNYEILYLNSFFNSRFSIFPVVAWKLGIICQTPVLLAPRGEFSPGALSIKPWKKRVFIGVARVSGVYKNVNWHASTEYERADIMRVMGVPASRIYVARNLGSQKRGLSMPEIGQTAPELSICFLSRISKKKNLDFALRTLKHVKNPIMLSIYGPLEDNEYWAECEKIINQLPNHINVRYFGALDPAEVIDTLSKHVMFFLPTKGENFGHVLLEAWLAGLLILTSDQTPWRGLGEMGVGWDLPLDNERVFAEVIDDVASWSGTRLAAARKSCAAFGECHLKDNSANQANLLMFKSVADRNFYD